MRTATVGGQLRVGSFDAHAGHAVRDLVDPLGRVFHPNPYNIPQWPWQILHFSLQMVLAMIDTANISPKAFNNKEEYYAYRRMTQDVVTFVRMQEHVREQPNPDADDGEWILYDPAAVRKIGRQFVPAIVYNRFKDIDADHSKPLKIARGKRWVAVVEVRPMRLEPWTVAFDISTRAGWHVMWTIQPCGNYAIEIYHVDADKLESLPRAAWPPFA